jgi:hypothetical protein
MKKIDVTTQRTEAQPVGVKTESSILDKVQDSLASLGVDLRKTEGILIAVINSGKADLIMWAEMNKDLLNIAGWCPIVVPKDRMAEALTELNALNCEMMIPFFKLNDDGTVSCQVSTFVTKPEAFDATIVGKMWWLVWKGLEEVLDKVLRLANAQQTTQPEPRIELN